MKEVLARLRSARAELEAKDSIRETALGATRPVLAGARACMNAVHRGELGEATKRYEQLLADAATLRKAVDAHPDLWHAGAVTGSLAEVAEAWALLALTGAEVEAPDKAATPEAFVLGIADAVGELRRLALDALIAGRAGEASERLEQMQVLYEDLRGIDVARAIADVRHKVDVARQLVDRTRGEVAMGVLTERMQRRDG